MMRKPRILIAASIYPPDPGGPAIHARAQFEGFPKMGFETELVALAHYRKWPSAVRHFIYFIKLLPGVWRSSIVYAHDAVGAGLPALLAAKLFSRPLVLRIGGDIAWERAGERKSLSLNEWYESGEYKASTMYKLSRFVIRRADLIIVTSRTLSSLYISKFGVNPSKLRVISNPVPETGDPASQSDQTIVFASRLVAYKNLDSVLQALAPIFRKENELKLLILGDGPERSQLEKAAENLGIRESVEFAGRASQEEVLRRTSQCLFTIAPALTEFNPNYVLQGISMGKPFVISWENGLPFDVPAELQFNPRSIEDIREKVSYLLTDSGYKWAENFVKGLSLNMSWDDNLRANIEAVSQLLNGSN